jgi:oxygen-dependent protoporphyrinogen oxidase
MHADVVIVGGGISGLAAAFELQQRGLSVRVLEASDRPGGVILTERIGEWVIDGGPDSLLVQKPGAINLCRELGLGDKLISTLHPRTAYVYRERRLYPLAEGSFLGFPLSVGALIRSPLFSFVGKLRMACELVVPRSEGDEDESIASFVRRRFGNEAASYLADPLLAGIHAGDAERLSVRSLFPRLVEAERQHGSVIRAFRAMRATPVPQGAFASLPGGIGELVDALCTALAPGTVQLGARVSEIRRAGTLIAESAAGPVSARAVILALPAYGAGMLLRSFDTSLASLCESIPYASTATVALAYRRSQIAHALRGSGFVVPQAEGVPLLAATWVTSKWPGRAPDGGALLRAFFGGGRDPHRLEQSDEQLITSAREELDAILEITGPPEFARVYRWTRQSPQYEVGHLQRMTKIEQRLASVPGIYLTGSGFRAIGIPDCIADARDTATRAAAALAGQTMPAALASPGGGR